MLRVPMRNTFSFSDLEWMFENLREHILTFWNHYNLLGILVAPSSLMTTPFSMIFSIA